MDEDVSRDLYIDVLRCMNNPVYFYLQLILTAGRSPLWSIERSCAVGGAEPPLQPPRRRNSPRRNSKQEQHQQTTNSNHHKQTIRKTHISIRTKQLATTTRHGRSTVTATTYHRILLVIRQVSNITSIILKWKRQLPLRNATTTNTRQATDPSRQASVFCSAFAERCEQSVAAPAVGGWEPLHKRRTITQEGRIGFVFHGTTAAFHLYTSSHFCIKYE